MSTHYTAIIEVKQVVETPESTSQYGDKKTPSSRVVEDVVHIVVRADTIEVLAAKMVSHIDLLA